MHRGQHSLLTVGPLLLFAALGLCSAATINVPADYATIQAAIDAASAGDEVVVAPDTYYENINFKGKAITVRSSNPGRPAVVAATIINGQQDGSVVTFKSGEGPASVLRGFTLTNGRRPLGGGVCCNGASPTITGNTITGNSASAEHARGGGIYCSEGSPTISGNTITGNSARGEYARGGGIYCDGGRPTITHNTISGNSAPDRYHGAGGVYCDGGTPTITRNRITDNSGVGIQCWDSSARIERNVIHGNSGYWAGGGIYCYEASPTITGNTIRANSAEEGGGGICCSGGSPTIVDNTITRNFASRWRGRDGVGGGISCGGGSPTIARNTISDNVIRSNDGRGAGIYCGASDATITDNTITGNSAVYSDGGGIYCSGGSPTIVGNTISGNSAGGIYGGGGGIYCRSSSARIEGNTITGNSATGGRARGGGLYCQANSAWIRGNTISGNSAAGDEGGGGGIYCFEDSSTIDGNTITGNSATGEDGGGGIYCWWGSAPTITNTIVAFSTSGGGISTDATSSPIVSYCDVYGNAGGDYLGFSPSGPRNISRDPLFADAAGGDFHLKSTGGRWDPVSGSWVHDAEDSPCINRGDPAADWSDEPVPNGGRVNMGAYGNTTEASKSRRLHLPELSWPGTTGYEADGVDPGQGPGGDTRFCFKVLYSDADGHAPRSVSLQLRQNGKAFGEFTMVRGVGDYTTGRVYRRTRRLPPGNYEHCFRARDRDGLATGEATVWTPGPIVGPGTAVALTSLSALPTNAGTQITFSLSSAAQVQARILNIGGRPIKTICHAKDCEAGANTLLWNAQSDSGLAVPNGTYLVEVMAKADDGAQARALIAVRSRR